MTRGRAWGRDAPVGRPRETRPYRPPSPPLPPSPLAGEGRGEGACSHTVIPNISNAVIPNVSNAVIPDVINRESKAGVRGNQDNN